MNGKIPEVVIEMAGPDSDETQLSKRRVLYSGVGRGGLQKMNEAGLLDNDVIAGLPDTDEFIQMLSEYPFFRAKVEFVSLSDTNTVFISGIFNDTANRSTRVTLDRSAREQIQRKLAARFYAADILVMDTEGYVVDYHVTNGELEDSDIDTC